MKEKEFIIEKLNDPSSENAEAVRQLTLQLGSNYTSLSDEDFEEMLNSGCNHLFVVKEKDTEKIVGMVTILIYRIPYAKKAYIDDFVIDKTYRKHGLGTRLFQKAIEFVKSQKVAYVDFTSSQDREAGNALYTKLGFQKRDTNVYRLNFTYEDR